MTYPADLARELTGLESGARAHLERLMSTWSLLSDLSFSDLILHVPIDNFSLALNESPAPERGHVVPAKRVSPGGGLHFVVLGQIRPATSQTFFEHDLVGQIYVADELPLVCEAWKKGVIVFGELDEGREELTRYQCIPVRWNNEVIAVLSRAWSPLVGRKTGGLERTYLTLFARFAQMISDGVFPFVTDEDTFEDAPRVGDGVIVLDHLKHIIFASPNAVNALHRMGITSSVTGSTLLELGLRVEAIEVAYLKRLPVIEEFERKPDVIVILRCIPLIEDGNVVGAVLLIRDVTDLRRRDRLLLSKDAAIREVHHRVKNNLQTISSLLRLQSRRLNDNAAKQALSEAERRIAAIALVHEILAREPGDQVPFGEIMPALIRLARDGEFHGREVNVECEGSLGEVPAEVATPLAVVIAELTQNAVEHAFTEHFNGAAHVKIDLAIDENTQCLHIDVTDNGVGFPEDFNIDDTKSLGLSIVRDLVRSQLFGDLNIVNGKDDNGGAIVSIVIPNKS